MAPDRPAHISNCRLKAINRLVVGALFRRQIAIYAILRAFRILFSKKSRAKDKYGAARMS